MHCCIGQQAYLRAFAHVVMHQLCIGMFAVASGSDSIVQEFHDALQRSPDTAVAVAAIKVCLCIHSGIANDTRSVADMCRCMLPGTT